MNQKSEGGVVVKKTLSISGMHCTDCAVTVEKALANAPGTHSAKVSYLKKTAEVEVEADASMEVLVQAVRRAGYGAEVVDANGSDKENQS